MVITFTTILLGLAAFIYPLRRNKFYLLNSAAIIGIAFYLESYHFRTSVFSFKTILLFVVFQLISINITTFFAYWFDKRAAQKGAWRVPERDLHILEFLGGWIGAWIAVRDVYLVTARVAPTYLARSGMRLVVPAYDIALTVYDVSGVSYAGSGRVSRVYEDERVASFCRVARLLYECGVVFCRGCVEIVAPLCICGDIRVFGQNDKVK